MPDICCSIGTRSIATLILWANYLGDLLMSLLFLEQLPWLWDLNWEHLYISSQDTGTWRCCGQGSNS
ncbi:hypothetical protein J1605_016805 [Eschrichtius robustus]|uniref:Uncharacterized protein n=1 Tax=Eschrichtius robustus TaxID=9764 RepID=A0AB34I4E0_ESCRO|nr:hypothetical protein J1605_016805 [Eschrichtius robustus]